MTFPTAASVTNYAGILAHLGWGKTYSFKELSVAIDEYLAKSDVPSADWPAVHTNFVHTSVDHVDMLQAYYGATTKLSIADDGETPQVSFFKYPPQ
jgi:hypothetical protein